MEHTFRLGERIKAARQLTGIRRGSCGTIALVYSGVNNVYDVQFDRRGLVRLLSGEDLAPLQTRAEVTKCANDSHVLQERAV
jgi:hypothetical protein